MKSTYVLVVWRSLLLPVAAAGQELAPPPGPVRAMDETSAEALEYGTQGSPAFRALLAGLDCAGVIVHVITGDTRVFGTSGTTQLVGAVGKWRHLRVLLRKRMDADERASVLAHELRHVLEIARSPAATQEAVRALYDHTGRPVPGTTDAFETTAASDAGMRVWRELRSSGRHLGARPGPSCWCRSADPPPAA